MRGDGEQFAADGTAGLGSETCSNHPVKNYSPKTPKAPCACMPSSSQPKPRLFQSCPLSSLKLSFHTAQVVWFLSGVRTTSQYFVPAVTGMGVVKFTVCRVQQVPKTGRLARRTDLNG